jgi:hypothetical protein
MPKRGNDPVLYASTPITKLPIAGTKGSPNVAYVPNLGIGLTNAGRIPPIRARGGLPSINRIGDPAQKRKSGLK